MLKEFLYKFFVNLFGRNRDCIFSSFLLSLFSGVPNKWYQSTRLSASERKLKKKLQNSGCSAIRFFQSSWIGIWCIPKASSCQDEHTGIFFKPNGACTRPHAPPEGRRVKPTLITRHTRGWRLKTTTSAATSSATSAATLAV